MSDSINDVVKNLKVVCDIFDNVDFSYNSDDIYCFEYGEIFVFLYVKVKDISDVIFDVLRVLNKMYDILV